MSVSRYIDELVEYGIQKSLIEEEDRIYTRNILMEMMGIDEYEEPEDSQGAVNNPRPIHEILLSLCDEALKTGALDNDGITAKDLFDTKLMGTLTQRPSLVTMKFKNLYAEDPIKATDWFYEFCCDVNYIRRDRIAKDRKWKVDSPYGEIDITINLSKPEKDPKAIAAALNAKNSAYPKCQLCFENQGYAGRLNHPARENHRIIPITVNNSPWGFQYSPYVYYNEHCIVLNSKHTPMKIDEDCFKKLFSFVEQFPHYFLGSNADLPIVGGSILTHDHFQGGHYTFAMEKAPIEREITISGYEDIKSGIVKWPLSVIRLNGPDKNRIIELATYILDSWRHYTDEGAFIYACTDGELHNTITPIARMRNGNYEMDLALRNNITTEEHPLGVYHPHAQYHNIKKENIGLIEVMGLAVLPARLEKEMSLLATCLNKRESLKAYEELEKHEKWVEGFSQDILGKPVEEISARIEAEIGKVFVGVLEDAGVYKCTPEGRDAFMRFVNSL